MNFDLNLDNYKKEELEEIFDLPLNYDNSIIDINETKLRQSIMNDLSVSADIKKKTLAFLNEAKYVLAATVKNKGALSSLVETYKNIYNSDKKMKKSDVIDSGGKFIIQQPSTPYGQSSPSEFYQGTINPLNKRILRKSLNIDTRFRENYYGTQASNFHLDLPLRMTNVVSMQLSALEFPTTFYNCSKIFGNNYFYIVIDGSDPLLVTIPDGNYTYDGLTSYLNTFLSTAPGNYNQICFTADIVNNNGSGKMIVGILSTHGYTFNFVLNFQAGFNGLEDKSTPLPLKFGWMMGFRNGIYENNCTYVSEGIIDLLGPRYLYLVVDDFNNNVNDGFYAAFTSSILNKNILARITLQGSVYNYLSQNNLTLITYARQYFGPIDLQKLQIQLLDEYGRIINLNNMDYSMCLTMQSVYDL
jgi:hypothetical protein